MPRSQRSNLGRGTVLYLKMASGNARKQEKIPVNVMEQYRVNQYILPMGTMQNKVCIVTGANSGIGKVTARALSEQGATLLMVCRNRQKGEAALEEIKIQSKNADVHLFTADLSVQDDIRRLAREIRTYSPRVDVLVNNAGGINPALVMTKDGLETTFAVNHLSYFLLTNLLLESLTASPSLRIVNVSSQAHQIGRMNFDDLGLEKNYNAMRAYAQSKLANILFTYELARRLENRGVMVNTVHPGSVRTNFGRNLHGIAGFFFRSCGFLMRSAEKGAETVVWLAAAPELNGVTGKYFLDKNEIRSSKISYDVDTARKLWDVSCALTGTERNMDL